MNPIGMNFTPPSVMIFEKLLDAIPMPGDKQNSETGSEKKDPSILES